MANEESECHEIRDAGPDVVKLLWFERRGRGHYLTYPLLMIERAHLRSLHPCSKGVLKRAETPGLRT